MDTSDPTPPPENGATGDTMDAYAKIWPHVEVAVEYCARGLAKRRPEREKLIQDARVELLRLDASRCNSRNPADLEYVRRSLRNCMKQAAKERLRHLPS